MLQATKFTGGRAPLPYSLLYIIGGQSDIAYENAMDDFVRMSHVPIVMTNHNIGHAGTFISPGKGSSPAQPRSSKSRRRPKRSSATTASCAAIRNGRWS
jgi:hypothetical protein